MPEKTSAANGAKQMPQFIKYRMTDEEMGDYMGNQTMDEDGIYNFLSDCVKMKMKFSLSYDNFGGGVQAFLTPSAEDDPNLGYTLSARAPDVFNAIGLLHYKHFVLFKRDWPKETEPRGSVWG
jgi:hypothetical protein